MALIQNSVYDWRGRMALKLAVCQVLELTLLMQKEILPLEWLTSVVLRSVVTFWRLMKPHISSFSAISIVFSGHAFLSFIFCPQLPDTAEASITLVPCSTACTRVGSLQKHVMTTLPFMLLCTFTYHIQYSLEDAPLPAGTVHEWQQ